MGLGLAVDAGQELRRLSRDRADGGGGEAGAGGTLRRGDDGDTRRQLPHAGQEQRGFDAQGRRSRAGWRAAVEVSALSSAGVRVAEPDEERA